ncbi:hypothetical protein EK904_013124, partial [Melospiza melodia maxima]
MSEGQLWRIKFIEFTKQAMAEWRRMEGCKPIPRPYLCAGKVKQNKVPAQSRHCAGCLQKQLPGGFMTTSANFSSCRGPQTAANQCLESGSVFHDLEAGWHFPALLIDTTKDRNDLANIQEGGRRPPVDPAFNPEAYFCLSRTMLSMNQE